LLNARTLSLPRTLYQGIPNIYPDRPKSGVNPIQKSASLLGIEKQGIDSEEI